MVTVPDVSHREFVDPRMKFTSPSANVKSRAINTQRQIQFALWRPRQTTTRFRKFMKSLMQRLRATGTKFIKLCKVNLGLWKWYALMIGKEPVITRARPMWQKVMFTLPRVPVKDMAGTARLFYHISSRNLIKNIAGIAIALFLYLTFLKRICGGIIPAGKNVPLFPF